MLFRGTSNPFGRRLPFTEKADAVEIEILNPDSIELTVRACLKFTNHDDAMSSAWYSLKSLENRYISEPQPLHSGRVVALNSPPGAASIIRIDFPFSYQLSEVSLFYKTLPELNELKFQRVRYLHRDGGIDVFDLDTESELERLAAALINSTGPKKAAAESVARSISALAASKNALPDEQLIDALVALGPSAFRPEALFPILERFEPWSPDTKELLLPLKLVALVALSALKHDGWLSTTGLETFKPWLINITTIETFMSELNLFVRNYVDMPQEFVISKHSINPAWLTIRRDAHLACLDRIIKDLTSMGIESALCYGTLLGAVRNATFIPHDDDVDLLYWDNSQSELEAIARRDKLTEKLRAKGYKVNNEPGLLHINVSLGEGACDLFPCWIERDRLYLMMENYRLRGIDPEIVLGSEREKIKLYDRIYPGPARTIDFLSERYGKDWRQPNKYFEWPWELK